MRMRMENVSCANVNTCYYIIIILRKHCANVDVDSQWENIPFLSWNIFVPYQLFSYIKLFFNSIQQEHNFPNTHLWFSIIKIDINLYSLCCNSMLSQPSLHTASDSVNKTKYINIKKATQKHQVLLEILVMVTSCNIMNTLKMSFLYTLVRKCKF